MYSELTGKLKPLLASRYELGAEIGAGGMATVFGARDLRHNRQVAIKVLHPELSAALGSTRFLKEIELTANLHHPHILPLFDSGEAEGLLYYVMPYVQGETLRQRLERERQLPVDEALRIARDLAGALDHAHRQGVIHRDLKPENILLDEGHALIADFGIALALSHAGGTRMTQTGVSLGTPQYMSPEQATGDHAPDKRTDVYSLGVILYEMLTGEPPHAGPTAQAVIARVLTESPRPIGAVRPTVPAEVQNAVIKALAKLPADRWGTAGDFARALEAPPAPAAPAGPGNSRRASPDGPQRWAQRGAVVLPWLLAAGATIAATVFALQNDRDPATGHPAWLEVFLPDGIEATTEGAAGAVALSPDGTKLVFQGLASDGARALYLRRLDDPTVRLIPGTEGGTRPTFSPDGSELLFATGVGLARIAVEGGTPRPVTDAGVGSWGSSHIVLARGAQGVYTLPVAGGVPVLLAALDSARGHAAYNRPEVLPSGTAALISIRKRGPSGELLAQDSAVLGVVTIPDGEVRELGVFGLHPRYSETGHVFFATADNRLLAAPFSETSLEIGSPFPVVDGIQVGSAGAAAYAVARNGTIAFISTAADPVGTSTPVAVDRVGRERPLRTPPGAFRHPRVSPDGSWFALTVYQGEVANARPDVWRFNFNSGQPIRVTADSRSHRPAWTPDGQAILYVDALGSTTAFRQPLFSGEGATPLVSAGLNVSEVSVGGPRWTAALTVSEGQNGLNDVYIAHMDSMTAVQPLLTGRYHETNARVSPGGGSVAYVTSRTGRAEVFVRPLVGAAVDVPVSLEGGTEPAWASSSELIYRAPGMLMSARLTDAPPLEVVAIDTLFPDVYVRAGGGNYDVMRGGQEFVMLRPVTTAPESESTRLHVILNWRPGFQATAQTQ